MPPLVVHVMYRFDTGGLENGIVNLINHMPANAFRHAVVALTEVTDFRKRIERKDVEFIALNKPPGHALWLYPRLYRLFRRLRPAIVHTRNLAALELAVPAWAAGVPARIHGEHGWDVSDMHGANATYRRLRRLYRPFVNHYVALSRDLAGYLSDKVGVGAKNLSQIYNGVDAARFHPREGGGVEVADCPFQPGKHWVFGTVGRMQAVKDQVTLAKAFVHVLAQHPELRERLRLILVGDGPLREEASAILRGAGMDHLAWLPGERIDVPALMRCFDVFVLPSLAEGVSNTILEAMATGLPVIATNVGGNAELVADGVTGTLVPANDVPAMSAAMRGMAEHSDRSCDMGAAGRREVERRFSLDAMVSAYQTVYNETLQARGSH